MNNTKPSAQAAINYVKRLPLPIRTEVFRYFLDNRDDDSTLTDLVTQRVLVEKWKQRYNNNPK